jgi:thiosulfate dehydrogenase [quinone] large subunit
MIDVFDHETRVQPERLDRQPSRRRIDHRAGVVLLPLRLFLAAGWLRAAAEKLIDPQWWTGDKLRTFVTKQHDDALLFFRPVMDHVIAPGAQTVAIIVVLTQLGCGLAIAFGKPLRLALRWAVLLNVVFIMAGKVNPSAFYLVMEIVLLFAVADGTMGVRPSSPSRKTIALAALSTGAAAAVAPYIRTIEPAKVIDDPAMMLVFLGVVVAVTLMARRAAHRPDHVTYPQRLWTTWAAGWMHAKPHHRVISDLEQWYAMPSSVFAPPERGTAVSPAGPQSSLQSVASAHKEVSHR